MKISGTTGTVLLLVLLAGAGAGMYCFKTVQANRQHALQAQTAQAKLQQKEADRKKSEAEARTAEAEASKKASESRSKASEAAQAEADLAAKKQVEKNLAAQAAADEAAAKKAEAEAAAAAAEEKKQLAIKAAAEASKAEAEKKSVLEALALKRVETERAKAADELAKTVADKKIADAARAKSENERKTAEANAQAEHDRKLRMYRRAETSRAEMLALQRAERLVALDEAGALTAADLETASATDEARATASAETAPTNAVVKVDWPTPAAAESPAEAKAGALNKKTATRTTAEGEQRARDYVRMFGALAEKAEQEKRPADAVHYRSTLVVLVPNYATVYAELIDEARKAKNRADDEAHLLTEFVALIPDWQRVRVFGDLLQRDEAYYSKALAGRVPQGEYVKTFRKLYDQAMRDKGDQDERRAKMQHLCQVLATYVPDFDKSPEWK